MFAIGIHLRSLPTLFLARALDGATGGNISVAQAAISDSTPPEHRAKNFGLIGAAFGLGFILGPYLGGKLSDPAVVPWFDAATPFWFAALLSLGNTLFVQFRFPETLKVLQPDKRIDWRKSARNINHAWAVGPLRSLFLTNFLFQFGFSSFTTFSSVFLISRSASRRAASATSSPTWASGSRSRRRSSRAGSAGADRNRGAPLVAVRERAQHPALLRAVRVVGPVAGRAGLRRVQRLEPGEPGGLLSRSASPRIQGEVLGINASVQALAQAFPPLLSGVIAGRSAPARRSPSPP